MTVPTLEERLLDLMGECDELAIRFMRHDAKVRALAKDMAAHLAEARAQTRAATILELDGAAPSARRRLMAVPPSSAKGRNHG